MKLVIDIPEMAYEAFREWHKNKVATVEQSIIANGTPYEPRPHGEWKTEPHSRIIHCSNCDAIENLNRLYVSNFCYSCGADMSANDRQVTGKLDENTQKHYGFRKKY